MNTWKKLRRKPRPDLISFLKEREECCVSAISRFNRGTTDTIWACFEHSATDHSTAGTSISGLLLYGKKLLFPVFNFSLDRAADYKKHGIPLPSFFSFLLKNDPLHAVQGLKDDLDMLEISLLKKKIIPSSKYDYELRSLHYMAKHSPERSDEHSEKDSALFEKLIIPGDKSSTVFLGKKLKSLVIRSATISDTDALFPLQAAYEKEEVLPKGAEFNPAFCRKILESLIADNMILAAELDGMLVGKININAHSWNCLQIGGVYVLPKYRSLGIARSMAAAIICRFAQQKKRFTLFVKKNNSPARRVYDSLGFKVIGEYQISYYS